MVYNFLFHRVSPERDRLWDPMDNRLFERCIKYISQNFNVILIEDLAFSKELFSRQKFATIMFDDGYKDNIDHAAPILDKYGCRASFYVVTECIEKNIPTWTNVLEHSFQKTRTDNIELDFDFLPDHLKVKKLVGLEARIRYVSILKPFLKTVSHENRNIVLNRIVETYNDVEVPGIMMNWKELKELKNAGHYIGSHTVTHCMLGTMTDETDIRKELGNSAAAIQNNLGHFPVTISYPVGSFNQTTKRISAESGYKIGLAVKQKVYDPNKEDLFEIPRIELYNEAWWKTRLRITNTLENIKSFIKYK